MTKEKRYRCVKEFYVHLCDDDGCEDESGEIVPVKVGETFYLHPVAFVNDVRLVGIDNNHSWLEMVQEDFEECFEEVTND